MGDRIHAREVVGHENRLEKLAVETSRLTYDQLAKFLGAMAAELARQAKADDSRGRVKLARKLHAASGAIVDAESYIYDAWDICIPYVQPEELESPGIDERDVRES